MTKSVAVVGLSQVPILFSIIVVVVSSLQLFWICGRQENKKKNAEVLADLGNRGVKKVLVGVCKYSIFGDRKAIEA